MFIAVIFAVLVTIFLVFRDMRVQFNIAIEMLEVVSSLFLSGEIDEDTFIKRKSQITDNFNWYQRHLYNKLKRN